LGLGLCDGHVTLANNQVSHCGLCVLTFKVAHPPFIARLTHDFRSEIQAWFDPMVFDFARSISAQTAEVLGGK
jgi:hypothetical protein